MVPQGLALRPIRLTDLPTLKRWRSLPHIQAHLRHPRTTWSQHLRWFLWQRHHPSVKVWAVTLGGRLVGQAGLYYRMGQGAEVSILMLDPQGRELFEVEWLIVRTFLADEARAWGLTSLWAEVLATAPLSRHDVFRHGQLLWADHHSTVYRWSL